MVWLDGSLCCLQGSFRSALRSFSCTLRSLSSLHGFIIDRLDSCLSWLLETLTKYTIITINYSISFLTRQRVYCTTYVLFFLKDTVTKIYCPLTNAVLSKGNFFRKNVYDLNSVSDLDPYWIRFQGPSNSGSVFGIWIRIQVLKNT